MQGNENQLLAVACSICGDWGSCEFLARAELFESQCSRARCLALGSGLDILARMNSAEVSEELGQQFVVGNRTGGVSRVGGNRFYMRSTMNPIADRKRRCLMHDQLPHIHHSINSRKKTHEIISTRLCRSRKLGREWLCH
jgi:hypothetical protein